MSVTFDKQTMSVEFSGETITFEQLNIKTNPEITQATEITITAAVKEIEENVFKDFYNLETINYEGSYIDWCKIKFKNRFSNPLFYTPNYGKRLVPTEGFDGYINTEKPDPVLYLTDVEYIPECTFYDLARNEQYANVFPFEDIVFGASLKEIGDYAFYGLNNVSNINSGLTLVDLQACESLQTIGTAAFSSCKYLQYVRLPKTDQPILIKDFAFSSLNTTNFELVLETDQINFGHYVFNTIHSLSTPAKFLKNFDLTAVKNLTIIETDNTVLTPELFKNLSSLETLTIKPSTDSTINMLSDITDCLKECSNLKDLQVSYLDPDVKYKEFVINEVYTNANNHLIQKKTTKQLNYNTITLEGKASALIRSQQINIIETDTTFSTTTTTNSILNDILFITSKLPPALATPDSAGVLTADSSTLLLADLAGTVSISLDALSQLYQIHTDKNTTITATDCLKIVLPANTLFIAN